MIGQLNEQSSNVSSVRVDDWTAELAIIASDVYCWNPFPKYFS